MGIVYAAVHCKSHHLAALKILPQRNWNDALAITRFRQEINVTGRFDHPNVIRGLTSPKSSGPPILVMEYLEGVNLSRLLHLCGPLAVADACDIARQIAEGLEHIHSCKVIHRDIKPGNVMLTRSGKVKVLDMGLALPVNVSDPNDNPAASDQFVGSFDYMAPEQANDSRTVTYAGDLYGLGATLYQLLCGEPPFSGADFNSPMKKLMALAHLKPASIKERCPKVPDEIAQILKRLLAKNPEDRFTSAADLAVALAPFTQGSRLVELIGTADANQRAKVLPQAMSSKANADFSATVAYIS